MPGDWNRETQRQHVRIFRLEAADWSGRGERKSNKFTHVAFCSDRLSLRSALFGDLQSKVFFRGGAGGGNNIDDRIEKYKHSLLINFNRIWKILRY